MDDLTLFKIKIKKSKNRIDQHLTGLQATVIQHGKRFNMPNTQARGTLVVIISHHYLKQLPGGDTRTQPKEKQDKANSS